MSETQSRVELIRRAATRRYPERIPIMLNMWKGVWRAFPDLLAVLKERGLDDFRYDFTDYYGYREPAEADGRPLTWTTAFGAEIVSLDGDDLGQAVGHIFGDGFAAMEDGRWTPPELPRADGAELAKLRQQLDRMTQAGYPRLAGVGCLMHELCAVRGFENTLLDCYDQPPAWRRLLDLLTEYALGTARRAVAAGAEVVIIGDDWGTQQALYCRPAMWREIFRPRYARIIRAAKRGGAVFFFHADGCVIDIIPDLLDTGADIVNPQLSCHDWAALRDAFGGRGCIAADLDRQRTLVFGSPAEITEHIHQVVEFFGAPEGGLILHAELSPNMRWEQVLAVLDGCQECAWHFSKRAPAAAAST